MQNFTRSLNVDAITGESMHYVFNRTPSKLETHYHVVITWLYIVNNYSN